MIGNDIVDLVKAKADSDWQRPRFLDKIFTSAEQEIIQNSEDKFISVWQLWSIKEAAYKLYAQINLGRFYNPKGFECKINSSYNHFSTIAQSLRKHDFCIVKFKDFECKTRTKTTSNYIYSEAFLDNSNSVSKCLKLKRQSHKFQSATTKNQLLKCVSEQFQLKEKSLQIIKSEFGIPTMNYNDKALKLSFSLTHHGSYGAFAVSV